jgi:hypothetical protein
MMMLSKSMLLPGLVGLASPAGEVASDRLAPGIRSHTQGVGMIFDFYQQRNKETDPNAIGGWAGSFSYDFALAGAACGMELDYVPGRHGNLTENQVMKVQIRLVNDQQQQLAAKSCAAGPNDQLSYLWCMCRPAIPAC